MQELQQEFDELITSFSVARENFYNFFDKNLSKNEFGGYNFNNETLNAKEVYELFFKYDTQARKAKAILTRALNNGTH